MAYPSIPEKRRKRGIGLALEAETLEQVEALAGGTGKRSEFLRETIDAGLIVRFGTNWREIANELIATNTDLRAA